MPFTFASGNLDQLNDFSGFDGFGTGLISARTGAAGNDGGGSGAHGGTGRPGAGGGGGGACLGGGGGLGTPPLHGLSFCNEFVTSLVGRLSPKTCKNAGQLRKFLTYGVKTLVFALL